MKLSSFSTFLTHPQSWPSPHLGTIVVISHERWLSFIYTVNGHLPFYCTDCSSLGKNSVFSPAVFSSGTLSPLSQAIDVCGFLEASWSPAGICLASTVWHKSHTANVETASDTASWKPCPGQHPLSMKRPAAAQAVMRILTELLYPEIHTMLPG